MRRVQIELEDEVAHAIEVRAAIDDLTLKAGIEAVLTRAVAVFKGVEE